MNTNSLYRIIQTDVCEIRIDYQNVPSFKILGVCMMSKLENMPHISNEGKETDEKNGILDSIESNIHKYFANGTPLVVDMKLLYMEQISPYYRKVLETLSDKVTHGKIITYQRLAESTGNPKASRAAGTAMALNPFPLIIPCHRVIKSDYSLGNFGSGVKLKLYLLENEIGKNSFKNFSLTNTKVLV